MHAALPADQSTLLRLVGLQSFIGWQTVASKERPAARILVPLEQMPSVLASLRPLGVAHRRACFDCRNDPSPVQGTHHHGGFVERGAPEATHGVIFFGIDDEFVDGAEKAEIARADDLLGRLYGYPACCAHAFAEATESGLDRTATSIPDPGPHSLAFNPLLGYQLALPILLHFPCSPGCRASHQLHETRTAYLQRLAPSIATLMGHATGLALYGPRIGMAMIPTFTEREDGGLRFDTVVTNSQVTRELFQDVVGTLAVYVASQNHFTIRLAGAETGSPEWPSSPQGLEVDDCASFIARFR